MGKYVITKSKQAQEDLKKLYKSGRKSDIQKINTFFKEIETNPREGTGNPEQLKFQKESEFWSRRINKKDRLIYEIIDEDLMVIIIQSLGHYNDK